LDERFGATDLIVSMRHAERRLGGSGQNTPKNVLMITPLSRRLLQSFTSAWRRVRIDITTVRSKIGDDRLEGSLLKDGEF
jgi:hypothetical protein